MTSYSLANFGSDTLAADVSGGFTSMTLTTGNFGSPSGTQILVIEPLTSSKRQIISCTIAGTSVTSVTHLAGNNTSHTAGATVVSSFTTYHHDRLANRLLGYAEVTANQGTYTGSTDLTGLSVTVTVPTNGARIKITGKALFNSSVANDRITFRIMEGATQINTAPSLASSVGGDTVSGFVQASVSATAGSHTYKLNSSRATGTGNITMEASSTAPAYIIVENIE